MPSDIIIKWTSTPEVLKNYYISLSGLLILAIIYALIYGFKTKYTDGNKVVNTMFLIISSLYLFLWSLFYFLTVMATNYPVTEEELSANSYAQVDRNYLYAYYGLTLPIIFLIPILLSARNFDGFRNFTFWEIITIAIILAFFAYTVLSIIYYIDISTRESAGFPLTSTYVDNIQGLQKKERFVAGITTIVPGLIIVLMGFTQYRISKNYNVPDFLRNKEQSALIILAGCILWIVSVIIAIVNNPSSSQTNYTYFLISFTAIAISFLILISFYMALTTHQFRVDNKNMSIFFLVLSVLAVGFSSLTLLFTHGQKIKNDVSLDNTNFQNYNSPNYKILNFSMSYNYSALTIGALSLMMLMIIDISSDNNQGYIKRLTEIFFGKNKNYNNYSIAFTGVFFPLFLLYIIWMILENQDLDINAKENENYLWIVIPLVSLYLFFGIEGIRNNNNDKDNQSVFMFKICKYVFLLLFITMPLVALVMYFAKTPKFVSTINDSYTNNLIFGIDSSGNGIPADDSVTSINNQFSVKANYANYGNGLFIGGGRSSLDLETTRNIRYVSNNDNYFNMKYLNNYVDDFGEITGDDNGLNIFTLSSNDISYGSPSITGDAYWVTVGENVGLTDDVVSTIFYNNIAGCSSSMEIKNIETMSDWNHVSNGDGAFSYSGNGVASGWRSDDSSLNRWVAVGQNDADFPDNQYETIKYSDDGKTWTNSTGISFSAYGNKVAFGPSGLGISGGTAVNTFVAVGYDYVNNNNIVYSINGGEDWSASTGATFSQEGNDVAYGMCGTSGVWVAVGIDNNYPIKYSIDGGVSWNNSIFDGLGKPEDASAISYNLGEEIFIVVGKKNKGSNSKVIYTSPNGITWTANTNIGEDFIDSTAIAYNVGNVSSNVNYEKIYHPPSNYQRFFVQEIESSAIKTFLIGNYVSTFIVLMLVCFTFYRVSKDPYIITEGKSIFGIKKGLREKL